MTEQRFFLVWGTQAGERDPARFHRMDCRIAPTLMQVINSMINGPTKGVSEASFRKIKRASAMPTIFPARHDDW